MERGVQIGWTSELTGQGRAEQVCERM